MTATASAVPTVSQFPSQNIPHDGLIKNWILGGGIFAQLRRTNGVTELVSEGSNVCTQLIQSAEKLEKIGKETFLMVDTLHRQREALPVSDDTIPLFMKGEYVPYAKLVDNPYEASRKAYPKCYRTFFAEADTFSTSAMNPSYLLNKVQWAVSVVSNGKGFSDASKEASDLVKKGDLKNAKAEFIGQVGHTRLVLEGYDAETKYFKKRLELTVGDVARVRIDDLANPRNADLLKEDNDLKQFPKTTFLCTKEGGERLLKHAEAQEKDPKLMSSRYAVISGGTLGECRKSWLNQNTQNCIEWALHGLGIAGITYSEKAPRWVEKPGYYLEVDSLMPVVERTYKCVVENGKKFVAGMRITRLAGGVWGRGFCSHALIYEANNTRKLMCLKGAKIPLDTIYPDAVNQYRAVPCEK